MDLEAADEEAFFINMLVGEGRRWGTWNPL
jgi:hypothetical protein